MKELIGRRVDAIDVEKAKQEWIVFHTDAGPLCYHAEADCCSETWFSDIIGLEQLIGQKVSSVEEITIPDSVSGLIDRDGRGRQESDTLYGYLIENGSWRNGCKIFFRNSSNGYYGGSLSDPIEIPKTRREYYDAKDEPLEWERIEKDWSAGATKDE